MSLTLPVFILIVRQIFAQNNTKIIRCDFGQQTSYRFSKYVHYEHNRKKYLWVE